MHIKSINITIANNTPYVNMKTLAKSFSDFISKMEEDNLDDLDFVKNYKNLKELTVEHQPKITTLPDLSKLSKLEKINLIQLKNLTDFKAIELIPNLQHFEILHFKHDPDLLIPVLKK